MHCKSGPSKTGLLLHVPEYFRKKHSYSAPFRCYLVGFDYFWQRFDSFWWLPIQMASQTMIEIP